MVRLLKYVWDKFIFEMIFTYTYIWGMSDEEVSIAMGPTSVNIADGWLAIF